MPSSASDVFIFFTKFAVLLDRKRDNKKGCSKKRNKTKKKKQKIVKT